MVQRSLPLKYLQEAADLYREHKMYKVAARFATAVDRGGNVVPDAQGIPIGTFEYRLKLAKLAGLYSDPKDDDSPLPRSAPHTYPVFPDDDIPILEIIDVMKRRFIKRQAAKNSKRWFAIQTNSNLPIGLAFIGDPHLDDDGCNWPLLDKDIDIMKNTPGIKALNLGDTTNNWAGRLMRLFANQETSQASARKLAKWFLTESGIDWLLWILGNHDSWGDGGEILRLMNTTTLPMENWQAQFKLVFPNQRECRVWISHDFKGNSEWNSLHALQKAAHKKEWAHVYAAGHKHNWALHQEESASRNFTYWLARARGYKFIDDYAENDLGHASQNEGATILAVINPHAKSMASFVHCYADLEEGADVLTHLRKKRG